MTALWGLAYRVECHYVIFVTNSTRLGRLAMARGKSGRIVLEVQSDLKKQLHSQVALEDKSLKDWFVEQASAYLSQRGIALGTPADESSRDAGQDLNTTKRLTDGTESKTSNRIAYRRSLRYPK